MSSAPAAPDPPLQALLDHIRSESERECGEITQRADAEVRRLLRAARHDAREHVRHALAAQRGEAEAQCTAARAAADTRLRRRRQQLARRTLDQAWPLLEQALIARWRDPQARALWVRAALDTAGRRLPGRHWSVAHPSDWRIEEGETLLRDPAREVDARWQPDAALSAGLRIESDGAFVDASLQGLLVRRAQIEGWLLAQLDPPTAAASGSAA